ncbi:hypothetical protein [Roseivirga thermotolerans]|uniref:Uncharacterized protein n=1 Tax=Roseivirga thermotolerans TaxID=1758176 RepID=A0ABQ3I493_9BACT|nr:hypothetical protein [Roseivirga thermotolerans]GHE62689.1 hypothetical protein GCM10011340_17430 [Roseivirga thermotolerans]
MLKRVQHDVDMVAFAVAVTMNDELGPVFRFPINRYPITYQRITYSGAKSCEMLKQVQHDVGMVAFVVHITVNNELGARFPIT